MMRKYIIGALFGFILSVPFSAFGSEIASMVGKKVQIEYPVTVNGKQLETKAIAINGVSYTPNRAVANALSVGVGFENKTVVITGDQGGEPVGLSLEAQIELLRKDVMSCNDEKMRILGRNGLDTPLSEVDQHRIDELNAQMANDTQQIKALQAQLTPTP